MSIITFGMYALDKYKAIKHKWRIKEKTLLSLSLFGGAIGGCLAMIIYKHKTKRWYFKLVNIFLAIMQIYIGGIL